ncbi:lysozyme inhibitor LprI family protein [Chachezhania sediminis]|uniref:lysozyme inhibitor LprI family protein n=1 Tax=Chachezhania sediminis TaxID=2599291 RepID=UPI00131DD53A|nr:hypothetical protein [Chachezhania sediminis]
MRLRLALPLILALAPASTGFAQSYSCANAGTPTEHAICKNRHLSNLDVEMATLFGVVKQMPMMMGARGAQQDAAQAFLTTRNGCGADTSCLSNAYKARISALKSTIADGMKQYCNAIQLC